MTISCLTLWRQDKGQSTFLCTGLCRFTIEHGNSSKIYVKMSHLCHDKLYHEMQIPHLSTVCSEQGDISNSCPRVRSSYRGA